MALLSEVERLDASKETLNNLGWVACVGVESAGLGGPRGATMQRQGSFSQAEYAGKKKQTRRDKFLAEMEQVVPWSRLVARLQPLYPKGERGRPPIGLERMLRIYFLQQWSAPGSRSAWPTSLITSLGWLGFRRKQRPRKSPATDRITNPGCLPPPQRRPQQLAKSRTGPITS